ncbi:hypothetical protein SSX86_001555 [Deinandra increscens subsp. villosa]|uniref:F-box domain-containing protein n=1 Tax=Deinandra increscens subsp. villosa TaxID=3103831 RepID=A0AAP0DVK2_9ASTR
MQNRTTQEKKISANIPFDIQLEIIKRVLPIKSLIPFRSVSKQWKFIIDSSEFITDYSFKQAHLLVRYEANYDFKYLSIVDSDDDDDSFSQHKFFDVVSPVVNSGSILDSCHELVCLYRKRLVVLWNPSIKKSVSIPLPQKLTALGFGVCPKTTTRGFGVCPKTNDPKIVMISRSYKIEPITWKAEVFTLSSGSWRSISMNMNLSASTKFKSQQVVIDGVIHWATYAESYSHCDRIITFDLISEEFGEVHLLDSLARRNLSVNKLNKSLVVLNLDEVELTCDAWMMKKNGFEKLFTIDLKEFDGFVSSGIAGFRKNGQPIREHMCEDDGSVEKITLIAYDPSTKLICDLGIYIEFESALFMITSYTESLLLLNNHSDDIIQG